MAAEENNHIIVEDKDNWVPMSDTQLAEMFGDFVLYADENFKDQFTKENFNYEVFDTDYYREKFPHFDDEVHTILAEVSKKKIIDLRESKNILNIKRGEFRLFDDEENIKQKNDT